MRIGQAESLMMRTTMFDRSVTRFRFGTPIETGAVIAQPIGEGEAAFPLRRDEHSAGASFARFSIKLVPETPVYGLGQVLGSLNRRGKRFRVFSRDDGLHTPDKPGFYGNHPFIYIAGANLALVVDCPGEIFFDVGFASSDTLAITITSGDFDVYAWPAQSFASAAETLLSLIGKPSIPPRWAFGYQQCRWSYPDERSVREVAEELRKHRLPSDTIYIDIDYMDRCKVFTVDPERFPDIRKLVADLREMGFRLVPIVDPGVRIEDGYAPYEAGLAADIFCKDLEGKPFVGAVWPGLCHFPDFLREDARAWWLECHREFHAMGFEHYWNDMNEPAIFYSPKRLKAVKEITGQIPEDADQGTGAIEFIQKLGDYFGSEDYYGDFTQRLPNGELVPHRAVHNLYGDRMALATKEALDVLSPGKRHFVLTRSSYLGTHRHAVMWFGDNHSWWEHMATHMRMLQSLNAVGFFFCGADVGGFSGNPSAEMLIRWMQLGVASPLFRNHSAKDTSPQEPWRFGDEALGIMRATMELRSAMLTYIYSEYLQAVDAGVPFIASLDDRAPDPTASLYEDEFFVGRSLLACPVHQQNARGRNVLLPGERPWLVWVPSAWNDLNCRVVAPGLRHEAVALNQSCYALPSGKLMALHAPRQHDAEPFPEELQVFGLVEDEASIVIWGDDGESIDAKPWKLVVDAGRAPRATIEGRDCPFTRIRLTKFDVNGERTEIELTTG